MEAASPARAASSNHQAASAPSDGAKVAAVLTSLTPPTRRKDKGGVTGAPVHAAKGSAKRTNVNRRLSLAERRGSTPLEFELPLTRGHGSEDIRYVAFLFFLSSPVVKSTRRAG